MSDVSKAKHDLDHAKQERQARAENFWQQTINVGRQQRLASEQTAQAKSDKHQPKA
jgi:hypothetical protein